MPPFLTPGQSQSGTVRVAPGVDPAALAKKLKGAGIRLYAVRHGQSEANARPIRVLSGKTESPLTPLGRSQALAAAQRLYGELGGDTWLEHAAADPSMMPVIYASPLSRAHDTGFALVQLLRQRLGALAQSGRIGAAARAAVEAQLVIHTDARLIEMGYGKFEMAELTQIERAMPAFYRTWEHHDGRGVNFLDAFPGRGGESRAQVLARVGSFLGELPVRHPGRTVLMFAHWGSVAMAEVALGGVRTDPAGNVTLKGVDVPNATPVRLA